MRAGDPFSVSAQIKETNGDTRGTGAVAILDGDTTLDRLPSIAVDPGGTNAGLFALNLAAAGTYTLTVAISDVEPGEWDTTNNTKTFTVKVVEPFEPYETMGYSA